MSDSASVGTFWTALGILGGLVFYGRFYVQWIASEWAGRSVMPIAFWYMSSAGSVMLVAYAFVLQSPLGALGQSLNIVIYSRNLIHIWREHDKLTPARNRAVHAAVAVIASIAVGLMLWTWWREVEFNAARDAAESRQMWFWLAVGVVGQGLFAARFLLQWLVTERRGRSVIPPAFWYLSLAAAVLQGACFAQRAEWVFAAGMAATLLIYARNIWFVRSESEASD